MDLAEFDARQSGREHKLRMTVRNLAQTLRPVIAEEIRRAAEDREKESSEEKEDEEREDEEREDEEKEDEDKEESEGEDGGPAATSE